jgi:uncharacterized cupredoxin-like copper-binding protein
MADACEVMPSRLAHVGFVALALLAVACSSSSQDGAVPPGGQTLRVKVSDFAIKAPKHIAAGDVVLDVRNAGPDTHELILVRVNGGQLLPFRPDDLTIDEDALKPRTVSVLEDDHPDTERMWKVRLEPGRYELFCNMSGHYLGGMHTQLVVP